MTFDAVFKHVVDVTAARTSGLGFKRNGQTLRLVQHGSAALIEFQKSRGNTREALSFTVNLALVCGPLLEPGGVTLAKARAIDGHLRERLGALLPDKQDKWWCIDAATDTDSLAVGVASLVRDLAAPYLLQYLEPHCLLALWELVKAPGLTEGMRIREVGKLKQALQGEAECH